MEIVQGLDVQEFVSVKNTLYEPLQPSGNYWDTSYRSLHRMREFYTRGDEIYLAFTERESKTLLEVFQPQEPAEQAYGIVIFGTKPIKKLHIAELSGANKRMAIYGTQVSDANITVVGMKRKK